MACQFWLSVDYTASSASIFNLFILSLDRYWSISRAVEYIRVSERTKKERMRDTESFSFLKHYYVP